MRHGDHVWGWLGQTILEQWRRFRRHLQVYAYHHELLRLPSAFPLLYVSQHTAFAPFQLPCTVTRTRVAPRTRLRQQTQTRQGHPASCRLSTTLQCSNHRTDECANAGTSLRLFLDYSKHVPQNVRGQARGAGCFQEGDSVAAGACCSEIVTLWESSQIDFFHSRLPTRSVYLGWRGPWLVALVTKQ